jgi:hypothetical protein
MLYSTYVSDGIQGIAGIFVVLGGIPVYYVMLLYKKLTGDAGVSKAH